MSGFYETDRAVAEYLLFHFGAEDLVLPWSFGPREALRFPSRCVATLLEAGPIPSEARALDLGCAVGGATFELARHCREVIGVDRSRKFIEAARQLARTGGAEFEVLVEGDRRQPARARVPGEIARERVHFETGDALNLGQDLGTFDVVLAANLLDRVPRPRDLLGDLPARLRPGGRLLLTSPYTWLEEYTPRDEWLGGSGTPTLEAIRAQLGGLQLVARHDLPFLIREHARKFQWSVAEATLWIRPATGRAAQ